MTSQKKSDEPVLSLSPALLSNGNISKPDVKSFGQVLWLGLTLTARSTLRGASAIWDYIRPYIPGLPAAPHWSTGRLWLLRLGCARLNEPKEWADDWIWFIDHTIQIGKEKCLLILGIRACNLPPDRPLRLADMVPIALSPTKAADKAQVAEELKKSTQVAGVPTAIISDHGADLHGGIQIFRQTHGQVRELYDLKHKAACLIKRLLGDDHRFAEYCRLMGQCKCEIQQTELDFLIPPSGRSKARFMNMERFISWGRCTLALLDHPNEKVLQHTTSERLTQKLGWLSDFREAFDEWLSWLALIEACQASVRQGITQSTPGKLKVKLPEFPFASAQQLRSDLLEFVSEQSAPLKRDERLPLMTEVLESSFGKLKSLEGDQQKRGFTSLVLSLGALVGTWTKEKMIEALRRTPTKSINLWMRTHFKNGTHHTKRCAAYPSNP